jgi:hypothetical protein
VRAYFLAEVLPYNKQGDMVEASEPTELINRFRSVSVSLPAETRGGFRGDICIGFPEEKALNVFNVRDCTLPTKQFRGIEFSVGSEYLFS